MPSRREYHALPRDGRAGWEQGQGKKGPRPPPDLPFPIPFTVLRQALLDATQASNVQVP